jgi:valyl-tRNA synthetase
MSPPTQPDQLPQPPTGNPAYAALPKAYDPSIIERRWAEYWVSERLFDVPTPLPAQPGVPSPASGNRQSQNFTMLLPPPNVTGRLHMGHMLNQTEMDILARWHRMCGQTSLWIPGTDHAGIATQMMVERQLAAEGTSRKELGPEAFTDRVWAWKRQYGSAITDQMKRLGASVDWSREYFTMDERLNVAVREAFVRLYEQGLIYRGSYIVNWDPVQQTAVSDLEVTHEERVGKLYHIRYPFADGTGSIVIATTRPETMLGDEAVVVNPADGRYTEFIGKLVTLPLSAAAGRPDREIPIFADEWANPEFGTGAVKVTPAHDPNDFEIMQRNIGEFGLHGPRNILDETAHVSLPGSPYHGLDRFVARERIVADLDAAGLLVEVRDHPFAIALSQRTGAVIEPRLSLQWFLAVNKQPINPGAPHLDSEMRDSPNPRGRSIAANAIAAVREGHIRFTPEMYEKTYMEWMTNIHDWCISRQLWWGHRIPAWHCAACHAITVARETPTACATCGDTHITQETDVLDTWFSAGLLPFTVFGWPGASSTNNQQPATRNLPPDLAAFYPTSLLVTGFDILFFWVARMIMLGCHFVLDVPASPAQQATFTEEERREVEARGGRPLRCAVPFESVYIHALVRDANREKMSKTKGNVVDPIEIIERFGTDAVRFTLASMASPGTDIAFSEARTEGNRAFANKIWNAARFLFMNLDRAREANIPFTLPTAGAPSSTSGLIAGQGGVSSEARPLSPTGRETPLESHWILTRLSETAAAVNASLTDYRFDEAANHIYQFFWGDLCDWYLEIVKLRLNFDPFPEIVILSDPERAQRVAGESKDLPLSETTAATTAALTTLVHVFESALRLLSPFMPFLTEEIWHALYAGVPPAKSIALIRYPQASDFPRRELGAAYMKSIQEFITLARYGRKQAGVPEKQYVPFRFSAKDDVREIIQMYYDPIIASLIRSSELRYEGPEPLGGSAASSADFDIEPLYERQIDIPAERERLTRDLAKYDKGLTAANRQLSNEAFMAKAPAPIVEGLRKQAAETRTLYDKTKAALDLLP